MPRIIVGDDSWALGQKANGSHEEWASGKEHNQETACCFSQLKWEKHRHYTGNVDILKHLSTNDLNFDAFVRLLTA